MNVSVPSLHSVVATVVALALIVPVTALAQPVGSGDSAEGDTSDVDAINAEAIVAFKAGRYEEAAALFEKAYQTSPEPNYLFNIGRVYEESGKFSKAIEFYERFINEPAVELEAREVALERLRVIRAIVAENEAERRAEEEANRPPEPEPEPEPNPEPEPLSSQDDGRMPPMRAGGIALLVVGAVGLGVAGGLAGAASSRSRELDDLTSLEPRRDAVDEGKRLALGADVMFGIGGLAVAVGAVLVGLSYRKGASGGQRAQVMPSFSPHGAGMSARVRF